MAITIYTNEDIAGRHRWQRAFVIGYGSQGRAPTPRT